MSNWTLAKYAKMCRDSRSDAESEYQDMLGDDMLWFDMAQCMLDQDDGLHEFIRDRIGARDVKGCLADDIAYPGNCNSYTLKPAKKGKK
jgi:hypothetical protein